MSNTTLLHLLQEKGVMIPIIQRDYIQGNNSQAEKRNKFLDSLFSTLCSANTNQNLDFVYGRSKEDGYMPLDGQQRLTTLFLLYWSVYKKKGNEEYQKVQHLFKKFKYKTRISTERFCNLLSDYKGELKGKISDEIRTLTAYDKSWDKDPSVISMLDLLDELSLRLETNKEKLDVIFDRLQNGAISFDLLDMESDGFKLTDQLYIKMNARGKQLTEFENFKANFIGFLEQKHDGITYENEPISVKFSKEVETSWTNLFWPYAYFNYSQSKASNVAYPIIDPLFMNLFVFITQMLYFTTYPNKKAEDFKRSDTIYQEIYSDPENVRFLIFCFDYLASNINPKLNDSNIDPNKLFVDIFDTSCSSKVRFFDEKSNNVDFFFHAIVFGEEMNQKMKFLLFAMLHYCYKVKEGKLQDFIRITRNYIETTFRRVDNKHNTAYISSLEITDAYRFLNTISKFESVSPYETLSKLEDKDLEEEKKKAILIESGELTECIHLLENKRIFKGNLSALDITKNSAKLPQWKIALDEIFTLEDDPTAQIIAAFLACGYNGTYVKRCGLGETYFYGNKGKWDRILTNGQSVWFESFLNKYIDFPSNLSREEKLSQIINENLSLRAKDWKYYFIKYPHFLNGSNYYTFDDTWYLQNERLDGDSSQPLSSFHSCPFYEILVKKLNKGYCEAARYSDRSFFNYRGIILNIENNYWKIIDKHGAIPNKIMSKYGFNKSNIILRSTEKNDLIETAIQFINDLHF